MALAAPSMVQYKAQQEGCRNGAKYLLGRIGSTANGTESAVPRVGLNTISGWSTSVLEDCQRWDCSRRCWNKLQRIGGGGHRTGDGQKRRHDHDSGSRDRLPENKW